MSKKILVVDDDINILKMTKSRLEANGYEVSTLSDPMKVEENIENYHPDLLIVDVMMPERSGFDIVEDFNKKKIYNDLPKIFFTGLDSEIEKMVAKSEGVSEYIVKPFVPADLVASIKKVLGEK